MGNKLTQEEQSLSISLQQQYIFQSNQFLVHKGSQRPCTLHRISTFSRQQSSTAKRNIDMYRQIKCKSISNLKEYFELDNSGYCSDQSKFYLVFEGHNSPNIKEEYFSRRYAGQGFSNQEIETILSCMLCGLRHYYQAFNRKESRIGLESVCIDRNNNNSLWLKDPWLTEKQNDSSQLPINFLATYPSPQKMQASNQAYFDYSQFRSDLFSVGIFGLQFLNMNFRDDLYSNKKFVDRQRVNENLNRIQNNRLRTGLSILLSQNPEDRYKIYRYWDINCSKVYRINNFSFDSLQASNAQVRNTSYLQTSNVQSYNIPSNNNVVRQQHYYSPSPMPNLQHSQVNIVPNRVNYNLGSSQTNFYNQPKMSVYPPQNYSINKQSVSNLQYSINVSDSKQNLSQQFNKPMLLKKGSMNENQKQNFNDNFKKKQKVNLQQFSNTNKIQFQVRPQSHRVANESLVPLPNRSFSPSNQISRSNKVQNSPVKFGIANSYNAYNQSSLTNKSIETPKFSYQSPTFNYDVKSSNNSHGNLQNSLQSNQSIMNSFQLYGSIPPKQQHNVITNQQNSPSSSPIMTKSIISSIDPFLNANSANPPFNTSLPKMSSEQNTQIFSNNQSLRQTKQVSETQLNSMSPRTSPPFVIPREKSLQVYQTNPYTVLPAEKNNGLLSQQQNHSQPTINKFNFIQTAKAKPNIIGSPQPHNEEVSPTSPSTIQVTPPPAPRNPNKYNSTIVEVNEQTPNQSSQSENQNNADVQFLVQQYETGSRYEGFKKNGLRHGRGKFFYQDGGYYDGEWKKNQMHGWGKLYYEGGQLAYEGNWAHDEFHGYGKVYNDNPVTLDGGFDYTNFDLLDDYWEFYEGMLANDTKEGRGRIQLTNKQVFEGDFHTDRIQGFGKFLRKDRTIVEGIWRDSRLIKVLNSNDIYK